MSRTEAQLEIKVGTFWEGKPVAKLGWRPLIEVVELIKNSTSLRYRFVNCGAETEFHTTDAYEFHREFSPERPTQRLKDNISRTESADAK